MSHWPTWFTFLFGIEPGDESIARALAERFAAAEERNAAEARGLAVPDSGMCAPMLRVAMEHDRRARELRAALARA